MDAAGSRNLGGLNSKLRPKRQDENINSDPVSKGPGILFYSAYGSGQLGLTKKSHFSRWSVEGDVYVTVTIQGPNVNVQ